MATSSPRLCESACCPGSPGLAPWPGTHSVTTAVCLPERQAWGPCSALHRTPIVSVWIVALNSVRWKVLERICPPATTFQSCGVYLESGIDPLLPKQGEPLFVLPTGTRRASVWSFSPSSLDLGLVNKASTRGLNHAAVYATCLPWGWEQSACGFYF